MDDDLTYHHVVGMYIHIICVSRPEHANMLQYLVCETTNTDEEAEPCVMSVNTGNTSETDRLALVTGRRLPAHGAQKEPHEPRSHTTLVDNLMVTWEIQQVSPLPRQLAAPRRQLDMFRLAAGSSGQHVATHT